MNWRNMLRGLVLMFGVTLWTPAALLAAEHGGSTVKEHGGGAVKEHGGSAVSGDAAVLQAAADALRATRPDLAAKLEAMAKELS